jgi:hypothetical protein
MKREKYIVKIEILKSGNEEIHTGWIKGIRGAVVQATSRSEVFTELGRILNILDKFR